MISHRRSATKHIGSWPRHYIDRSGLSFAFFLRVMQLGPFAMGKDPVRVALQGLVVMFRKAVAGFGRQEESLGLRHEGIDTGRSERLLFVERFIHRND